MRRLAILVAGLLVLGVVPASAAPDVVKQKTCSDGASMRLELTDIGHRIKLRFEVRRSPVGHHWRIKFRYVEHNITNHYGPVFFWDIRVASDSGVLVVQLHPWDLKYVDGIVGEAVDRQTGEVCRVLGWYR